jgi:hypothetical protein
VVGKLASSTLLIAIPPAISTTVPADTVLNQTTMKTVEFVRQRDVAGHERQVHFQPRRGVDVNHLGQEDTV